MPNGPILFPRGVRALLPLLLAAACTGPSDYPSLAPRPIEDVSLAEPAPPPPAPATGAAAADARYAPLVEKAKAGDAAFLARLRIVRPGLEQARGAAVGSDAWSDAQQTLSRLLTLRAPVIEAGSALQAASEAPETHDDTGLADAVARAIAMVHAIDAGETAALAGLAPAKD